MSAVDEERTECPSMSVGHGRTLWRKDSLEVIQSDDEDDNAMASYRRTPPEVPTYVQSPSPSDQEDVDTPPKRGSWRRNWKVLNEDSDDEEGRGGVNL